MSKDTTNRRSVLAGLTILPAAAVATPAAAEKPDALKPDGTSRHDPVMPDSDHTRTYLALARS
ncbi:hypothetical protein OCH239_11995 [Roseivivax halodurans JCM 10272]|uniref:Twin-arginine translocation pathway signal protein n=1 Tax=Roseivivax halodurans JCM 10272 TaxID=1449350 RepID=X7ELB7_9RHOB|nr:hypothetical protein [Roseivivax halodurans]ETX15951.1 hypothetical protein OCH239_11995 [Roseivivax halodurans JCM 10272]